LTKLFEVTWICKLLLIVTAIFFPYSVGGHSASSIVAGEAEL
jgi:hypothetical protein